MIIFLIIAKIVGFALGIWIVYALIALISNHGISFVITLILVVIAEICTGVATGLFDLISVIGSMLAILCIAFVVPIQVKSEAKTKKKIEQEKQKKNENVTEYLTENDDGDACGVTFCQRCGYQMFDDDKKCANCGFENKRKDCKMEINYDDFLIIKTTPERIEKVGSLYNATHYRWRVKIDNVEKYPYVLAVVKGYVEDVFAVEYWQPAKNRYGESGVGRYEFVGHLAPIEIRKKFFGKRIPEVYRKQGMASPVLFPKKEANWN